MGCACLQIPSNVFSFEPRRPVRSTNYVCDKLFALDELRELQQGGEEEGRSGRRERWYGISIINGRSASFFLLSSFLELVLIESIGLTTLTTQKKQKKGGSSAPRIGRLKQNKTQHNVSFIVEKMVEAYWDHETGRTKRDVETLIIGGKPQVLETIIVGGAGTMYEKVVDALPEFLRSAVCAVLPWAEEENPRGLFEAAKTQLEKYELEKDREILKEFWQILRTRPELLDYGVDFVTANLFHYRKIFCNCSVEFERGGDKVVYINRASDLDEFGGVVGVRYSFDGAANEE